MLIVLAIFLEVLHLKKINRQIINIWQDVKIINLKLFNGKCLNLLKNNKRKISKNKISHNLFLIKLDWNKCFNVMILSIKKKKHK